MQPLPILQNSAKIIAAARSGRRLIISSPPGSGKSTQVPQLLLDNGLCKGKIAVLEPRRLAARMLAERVAKERGASAGGEIGYRVRFDDKTSKETRVIFETEGILLRELVSDPKLSSYSAVILDEFHERHLHGDIALAVCLALQRSARPDLLVVVMSATLDLKSLSSYLAPCETILAQGTVHPVQITYCDSYAAKLPVWEAAAKACGQLASSANAGHALVFMPGAYEISRTADALRKIPGLSGCAILPLHGDLSPREQDAALAPSPRRKIIIATNIAETSLTIDGVTLVVDSGLAKIARYDAVRGINTLFTEKTAYSSSEQRAGRAGRTAPGICLRLWTEQENKSRPLSLEPEIARLDLSEALLTLKACGFSGFDSLAWPDNPNPKAVERARTLLRELGACSGDGKITEDGRLMARYPLHPRHSRMMLEAKRFGCAYECAAIAALSQGRAIKTAHAHDAGPEGSIRSDFAALSAALEYCASGNFSPNECQGMGLSPSAAREVFRTLKRLAPGALPSGKTAEAARCFLRAFPDRVAALLPGTQRRYVMTGARTASLDRESAAVGATIICAGEALEKSGRNGADITLSLAAEIREEWLREAFPGEISTKTAQTLHKDMLTPVCETVTYYRDIPIRREQKSSASGKPSTDVIAAEFANGNQKFDHWNEEVEEFLDRVEFLHTTCPDLGITPLGAEDLELLAAEICEGAVSVAQARSRPVLPALQNWFGWDKVRLIEQNAPTRLQLPSGRKARIRYPKGREPYLEAKIQDLFGMNQTPKIAAGRVPLVVHILAPSMRPVQVTKDLQNFWKDSYPKLKPQLARRYPRHKWL